uniref:Uncharacterized protein n=1 Tax=Panagrolaimus sp. ES5 TaxID=591445 RepID=A0AC34FLI9_9BILA
MAELRQKNGVAKTLRYIRLIVFEKGVTTKYFDRCENFICFFASSNGFALVFDFVQDAKDVYKVLNRKKINHGNSSLSTTTIERRFIVPMIKELSNYSELNFDFRCSILKLFKSLDVEQKHRLAGSMIETKIDKSLLDCVFEGMDFSSKTPKVVQQDKGTAGSRRRRSVDNSFSASSSRHVTFAGYDQDCVPTSSKKRGISRSTTPTTPPTEPASSKKRRTSRSVSPSPINSEPISSPFEVIEYSQSGALKKHLFIFTSEDKVVCYEYYWETRTRRFRCLGQGCRKPGPVVRKDADGFDRVYFEKERCQCLPREFDSERYKSDFFIFPPNYKLVNETYHGREKQKLYIFTSTDKKKAYKFDYEEKNNRFLCIKCRSQKKVAIRAILLNEGREDEHVAVQDKMHKCEPVDC